MQGILKPCQKIHGIIKSWQYELQSTSPRKHFRTLSEREVNTSSNQLDYDIAELITSCTQIGNLSMELGFHTQNLLNKVKQGQKVAQHWLQMINPNGARPDLIDVILDAQILVPLTESKVKLDFENRIDEAILIDHIDMPTSNWTSIIYHTYLANIANYKNSKDPISLQSYCYQKDEKTILIVAVKKPQDP